MIIYLDHNRASSLALVINELLQNAYEHAFSNKKYQKIKKNQCIRLQMTKNDDIIRIQVIDNVAILSKPWVKSILA